jgi:hypothetical protein
MHSIAYIYQVPLYLRIWSNVAHGSVDISGRDFPSPGTCCVIMLDTAYLTIFAPGAGERERMGRIRMEYRERLAHAHLPGHVQCNWREDPLGLRRQQRYRSRDGMGILSRELAADAGGDGYAICK